MKNIWKQDTSVSARVRQTRRSAFSWLKSEGLACLTVTGIIGGMILMTLVTIGNTPSGPAADVPSSPRTISSDSTSITPTGHGPCITQASRADHGQLMGSIER